MSCSTYAIEMGSWKENENDLYFSWFLPKHVCSVGVLESFPEGKSQNLQCQSWIRVSLKRMKLVQCCMNGKCQIKGAIAVTYTEVLRKRTPSFTLPCPFPKAIRESTKEKVKSRLSWPLRCVTLGMSVNFSICCSYIELELSSLFIFLWTLLKEGITKMQKKILPATAALWGYTMYSQHRKFRNMAFPATFMHYHGSVLIRHTTIKC